MIDNAVWGEVSLAMFVVAVVVLFATHWTIEAIVVSAEISRISGSEDLNKNPQDPQILRSSNSTISPAPHFLKRFAKSLDLLTVERPVAVTLRLDRPLVAFQRA